MFYDAPAHESTGPTESEKSGGSDDLEFSCVSLTSSDVRQKLNRYQDTKLNQFSCVPLTSSDVRCSQMLPAHVQRGGGGEASECSELAAELARQRARFVGELEKQADERDRARAECAELETQSANELTQRANESALLNRLRSDLGNAMKSAREREEHQQREEQQREEQRERELAWARERERGREREQERSRAVDLLEQAVESLENSMDAVFAEARLVDQRIKTNEEVYKYVID